MIPDERKELALLILRSMSLEELLELESILQQGQ